MRARTGLERLLGGGSPRLAGRRLGLIANPSSVNAEPVHSIDLLCGSPAARERIDRGAALGELAATWTAALPEVRERRAAWLLDA